MVPPNSEYPALNISERETLEERASGWLRHSLRPGDASHFQFGQIMPQVLYSDLNMTSPLMYDDIGDAAAWTGHFLAALVHKFVSDPDPTVLTTTRHGIFTHTTVLVCMVLFLEHGLHPTQLPKRGWHGVSTLHQRNLTSMAVELTVCITAQQRQTNISCGRVDLPEIRTLACCLD